MIRRLYERFKNRKLPKLEAAPLPSEIAKRVANAPHWAKRAHKLAVRREYRSRRGVMSSNQRQILAEMVATQTFAETEEHAKRQAEEDRLYNVHASTS